MQKCWHYIYLILYPSLGYKLYYGSRISKKHPDDDIQYFGSPVTFAHYNDPQHPEYQADAVKVIIAAEYVKWSKRSAARLCKLEKEQIIRAHEEHGAFFCLNRCAAGRFLLTKEELSAAGKKSAAISAGVHGMSADARDAARRRGGQVNALRTAKTYRLLDPNNRPKKIHNMTAFCRKHNLTRSHMFGVANGKERSHKGWRKA